MKIKHEIIREINAPKEIVFENFLDLDHINFVHKRCYKYCNIVKKTKNYMLLDVGVYHLPPLPIVTHYTMFHEIISKDKIIHLSKRKNSSKYVKSEIYFSEISSGTTKIIHKHDFNLPIILFPLKNIILKLIDRWSNILWQEDSEIMSQRQSLSKEGFKDGFHCGKWEIVDGKPQWQYNERNK